MNEIKTPMDLGSHIVKDFYGWEGANDDYAMWVAKEVNKLEEKFYNEALKCTGLKDFFGNDICFGNLLMVPVTINKELHGEYSIYRVLKKGSVAVLSYVVSEKGKIVPEGYMSCLLTDKYSSEDLCLVNDISKIKPLEEIQLTVI